MKMDQIYDARFPVTLEVGQKIDTIVKTYTLCVRFWRKPLAMLMNISGILKRHRAQYVALWLVSVFIALLALSPFIYLMQVHSRVFTSRSLETFVFLTGLATFALVIWGATGYFRDNALSAIGFKIDHHLRTRVFNAVHHSGQKDAFRSYSDIATVREGLTGNFVSSVLDGTLTPLFVGVLFLLHPVFGWVALGFILIVALLSYRARRNWKMVRAGVKPLEDRAFTFGLASAAKSDVVRSMNLLPGLRAEWSGLQNEASDALLAGKISSRRLEAVINTMQRGMMVLIIGVGAVLFLMDEVTAEVGFAAFIVMMRGVNPVLAIAKNWSVVQETRDAMDRLNALLVTEHPLEKNMLPAMTGHLTCSQVGFRTQSGKTLLSGVQLSVPPGSVVAVIGPSGAGKSTLLRLLAGAATPTTGRVKIDGFPLQQWPEEQLGAEMGYLPQSVDLLPGTVAQNVSRFETEQIPEQNPEQNTGSGKPRKEVNEAVLEALARAGALELVQGLERGLDFRLAPDGAPLSGGQKQRIGLARAYYKKPKLLVLDEPDSALDAAGEKDLAYGISEMKRAGSTVVFSTHKTSLLDISDYVLIIKDGYMHSFSSRQDVVSRLGQAGNRMLPDSGSQGRGDAA